jgi:hypothetical protein
LARHSEGSSILPITTTAPFFLIQIDTARNTKATLSTSGVRENHLLPCITQLQIAS